MDADGSMTDGAHQPFGQTVNEAATDPDRSDEEQKDDPLEQHPSDRHCKLDQEEQQFAA